MIPFIQSLSHWIYCLPLWTAIVLTAAASVLFFLAEVRLAEKRGFRILLFLFLILWCIACLWITLGERSPDSIPQAPLLLPFQSYAAVLSGGNEELIRSNFMNALLFYPFGLLLASLLPSSWSVRIRVLLVTLLAAAISIGVEVCQYHFVLGLPETDDVLHNVLGALLGSWVTAGGLKRKREFYSK